MKARGIMGTGFIGTAAKRAIVALALLALAAG